MVFTGPVLAVEGLGKRYGGRWIFRGISFALGPGDRLVVRGRNGAGKSTLLKTLAGLIPASEGKVRFEGDPRLAIGMSTLDGALYATLSAREHLELVADLRGCDAQSDALLQKVGLAYAAEVPAGRMSTGMKARLKLAMAVQAQPQVLLLDEPGASLDEEGRAVVEVLCDEQAARGCVVIATNDPAERRLAKLELVLEA